jgi:hypothetical protein
MIEYDYVFDFLSDLTRKERRNLLAASAIGIVVAKTGLVPTKIAALGIEFSPTDRTTFLKCLSGVVAYFLVAFIIYAADDYVAIQHAGVKRYLDSVKEPTELGQRKAALFRAIEQTRRYRLLGRSNRVLGWVRNFFDFALPIVIGAYSLIALWTS